MGFLGTILIFVLFNSVRAELSPVFGYHEAIGIPKAETLKYLESKTTLDVGRIVGGSQVAATSVYPYNAGIVTTLTTGWTSVCGGALVSATRVLTAAHCWWDGQNQAREFTIVLGSVTLFFGGTRITSSDVIVHPNWNTNAITNDVAVVRITSVTFSNDIQAIPLPSTADISQDFSGLVGTAVGYGKTSDAQNSFPTTTSLYHVNLNIISNTVCQRSFDLSLHGSHLCTSGTGGVGTCDGDSGGPLTVVRNNQRTLVGIVSFGLAEGCQSGLPSVYTRVTSFLTWIQANM